MLLRHDYLWYFQAGLAGQYVLGPIFHPSIFGVLLLLSIYPSVQDRPLAAVCHATYLLAAAILTIAYHLCSCLILVPAARIAGGSWALAFLPGMLRRPLGELALPRLESWQRHALDSLDDSRLK
jgi:hypothetical protein